MKNAVPENRKRMSEAAVIERDEAGQRCGWLLRQIYGTGAAKHIAREFDVAVVTAEKWLAGQLPQNRALVQMGRRFGRSFAEFVLCGPDDWEATARIEAEIAAIHAKADALRNRRGGAS